MVFLIGKKYILFIEYIDNKLSDTQKLCKNLSLHIKKSRTQFFCTKKGHPKMNVLRFLQNCGKIFHVEFYKIKIS